VVPLLELFLPGITAKKGVAVLIDPLAEVLIGHADLASFPTLELPLITEVPLLHSFQQ